MTTAGVGAYILLICYHWQEGSLPVEEKRLARIAKMSQRNFRGVWPTIEPCLTEVELDGGRRYIQKRVSAERDYAVAQAAKNRINGAKGGRPKNPLGYRSIEDRIQSSEVEKKKKIPLKPPAGGEPSGLSEEARVCSWKAVLPVEYQTPGILDAFAEWQVVRQRKGCSNSRRAKFAQVKKLAELAREDVLKAEEIVLHTAACGWKSIFPPKEPETNGHDFKNPFLEG